jgi:hypothetical protein
MRSSVRIQLILRNLLLVGLSEEVDGSRRLSDLLNSRDEIVHLRSVRISEWSEQLIQEVPELTIEKKGILAALPQEDDAYQRQRLMSRAGLGRPQLMQSLILCVIPPLLFTGIAHLQPGVNLLRPDPAVLPRFFALTGATMRVSEDLQVEAETILVSRDQVSAITKLASPPSDEAARGRRSTIAAFQGR